MPTPSLSVAVVCGGPSPEAEVSRNSAAEVAKALRQTYAQVAVFELDDQLVVNLQHAKVDVVFPVAHGAPGEDGALPGLLDILGLAYVGCDVKASACAMDKVVTKRLVAPFGVPVVADHIITAEEDLDLAVANCCDALGTSLVAKPVMGGSSLGVSFIRNAAELKSWCALHLQTEPLVLVEKYIQGREITVAVLEQSGQFTDLPVVEVLTPENSWYDYEHRYVPSLSEHVIPAALSDGVRQQLQAAARGAHQALGCRDLSRSDFIVTDDDQVYFLELNNLPGMTATSLYPDAANAVGIDFATLLSNFIEHAVTRGPKYV